MTKPIIVVRVPCKLLYVIQVKEFLIKCLTSWPYLISEFLVAYITIVASDWPRTFFTPKVFLFSMNYTCYFSQIVGYIYNRYITMRGLQQRKLPMGFINLRDLQRFTHMPCNI